MTQRMSTFWKKEETGKQPVTILQCIFLVYSDIWLRLPESYPHFSDLTVLSPQTPCCIFCCCWWLVVCAYDLVLFYLFIFLLTWFFGFGSPFEPSCNFSTLNIFTWLWLIIRGRVPCFLEALPPTHLCCISPWQG